MNSNIVQHEQPISELGTSSADVTASLSKDGEITSTNTTTNGSRKDSVVETPKETKYPTPMSPYQLSSWRYDRLNLTRNPQEIRTVLAMHINLDRQEVPSDWEAIEHPEGKLYYQHKERKILTHTDIRLTKNLNAIEEVSQRLQVTLHEHHECPSDLELVLDLRETNGETEVYYYYVSWKHQAIVWVKDVDIWYLTCNHRMVYCQAHLRHAMEWQFWLHVEMFPNGRNIDNHFVDRLTNTLAYGWNDLMTSETSTTPYNADKIGELSRLIGIMKGGYPDEHRTTVIARNMSTLSKERFYNYHGQPGARMNRDETMSGESIHRPRSLTFLTVSPVLFWLPDVYLADLEAVWVDETVNYRPWNKFFNKLIRDWKASEMPAIILFVVNAGSLSIQNTSVMNTANSTSTVACYASMMLSLTAYVVSRTLTRQHEAMIGKEDVGIIAQYLHSKSKLYFGFESPAFAFSLPMGCFIWSMLVFAFATCYNFFQHAHLTGRVINGILLLTLSVIVTSVMYMNWGANPATQSEIRGMFISTLCKTMRNAVIGNRVRTVTAVV